MKTIKSTVTYNVPHWNFCNIDTLDMDAKVPKETCRFCVKTKDGNRCLLYDKYLQTENGLINKVRDCCKATAGFESNINTAPPPQPQGPKVSPKELMSQTIDLYDKTVKDLMSQGYPQPIATKTAKKYILGDK